MKYIFGFITILASIISVHAQIKVTEENDGLLFSEKNEKVLFYQMKNKSLDGTYSRCNYIHPLWAFDGTVLTEDFPADHLHHRGIFWAWHQVWINGRRIGDPWEIRDFAQQVVNAEFQKGKNGVAVLNTTVNWKSELWKKDGKMVPYLKEESSISIYPRKNNYRQIDFEICLLALEDNLSVGGSEDVKGYSGFSVRMVLPPDVSFCGPDGLVEPQNEAVISPGFVSVSGNLLKDAKKGGVVMVDHPKNPGYPQSWILRKKNSMQNAVYPGNTTVLVSTQKPLVLKYSLLVYEGELSSEAIKEIINPWFL